MPLLFSYGTLQLPAVQQATYGRLLEGVPDALRGYRLADLIISDPRVVNLSGAAVHRIARHTGDPADRIAGMRFEISDAELAASDAYEVDAYGRSEVELESGVRAFVYVGRPPGTERSLRSLSRPSRASHRDHREHSILAMDRRPSNKRGSRKADGG